MRRKLFFLAFLFISAAALAQFGGSPQGGVKLRGHNYADVYAAQKALLSNYCRLDFEGTRLQPAGWNRFKPFTSLRANPEFTRVIIVSRFDIESPEQPSERLSANYKRVGYYQEGEGYIPSSGNERVDFRVQERNGEMVVIDVSPETPHVSPRAALAWMNTRLADPATGELERSHLQEAVKQLNKLMAPRVEPAK